MNTTDEELIKRLQEHLSTIRKAAGWSGEWLANELGVTKQTISSLETGKTQMTKMHYLAIRAVFNNEIVVNRNEDLAKIIQLFVDQPVIAELEKSQITTGGEDSELKTDSKETFKQSAVLGATLITASIAPAATVLVPVLGNLVKLMKQAMK